MELSLVLEESPDNQIEILLGQFIATPASVILYANAAAASAASANLSQTNAGVSATSAAGSATNAATSATQAATSASNAAGSASAAAASAATASAAATLTTNASAEVFNAGTGFTPGVTTSITLAGSYGSINNVLVTFDDGVQRDCTLAGHVLSFNPTVPVGVSQVVVSGGRALAIGTPADGTVGDTQLATNSSAYIITQNAWTLKRMGCKVDGVTDDTNRLIAALASGELDIYADPGVCVVSGTIPVVANFQRLRGAAYATRFLMQTPNLPIFQVATSLTGVCLQEFVLDRAVPATAGGDGISWLTTNSQGRLQDILAKNCWNGFDLGPTDYSKAVRCISQLNYAHGFYITNGSSGGPCQWSVSDGLAQNNNGDGMFIDGTSNAGGGMSLGEVLNFSTFANTGFGIIAAGSPGNPINGLRILGGFIGGDGNSEIYLDTYGGQHKIVGVESELTGTSPTGRTNSTAPSNIGSGIAITPNNQRVQVSDPNINGTSAAGIGMNGTVLSISNPHITNCGVALVGGSRNGITAVSGRTMVVGGYLADTGQNSQQFGISAALGATVHLTGTDLTGNTISPTTGAGTIVSSNCLP
jgi:hypothetical protein